MIRDTESFRKLSGATPKDPLIDWGFQEEWVPGDGVSIPDEFWPIDPLKEPEHLWDDEWPQEEDER